MKNINIKTKILLLTIIPLIVVSVLIISLAAYQAKALGDRNIDSFSTKIFELRRTELKNYTDVAVSALKHITKNTDQNDPVAQEEIKDIVRNMKFGVDGYFYAYEGYTTRAHPTVRSLEGGDQRNMTDPNGVKIIQELYKQAIEGGGFTSYVWLKPSRGRQVEKIGYSNTLDGWNWWIGTGLYVDDLEDAIQTLQESVDKNIATTLKLILLLAFGAVVLVGIIGVRITLSEGKLADEKLQALSRKSVESQEAERSRVARQLQSSVIQSLTLTKSKLRDFAVEENFETDKQRNDFLVAAKALQHAMKEIRAISGELRPEILDSMGLDAAINELINKQKETHNDVKINYKSSNITERLDGEVEIVLYRIIQLALANVYEHSNASSVNLRINIQKNKVIFSIQDNGSGFDVKNIIRKGNKAGIGLIDMRVRAEALGGHFSVFSTPEIGTHIKVEIPR
jgi:two-component system NarL family sensor kinase